MSAVTDFTTETAVVEVSPGRYSGTMTPEWGVPRGANGGVVAAFVLRAMQAHIADPSLPPRTLTVHYLRPPAPGQVEVEVEIERSGRTLSSVSARMYQDGKLMVIALAAFGRPFAGPTGFAGLEFPDVGLPPDELKPIRIPPDVWLPPVVERCRLTTRIGVSPRERGTGITETGGWLRFVDPVEQDYAALAFYADAWAPVPFMAIDVPSFAPTIELTVQFLSPMPHAGLTADTPVLGRFTSSGSKDGYFVEDGDIWASDGTLLAQSRQLACLLPQS